MKKIVGILMIAIIIALCIVGYMFWNNGKKKDNQTVGQITNSGKAYGNRGSISQVEKIKFLTKNDDYLIGMIGLPVVKESTEFTNDDMIRFALNIAVSRYDNYSNIITTKTNKDGTKTYVVPETVVFKIIDEYFGLKEVSYDKTTNEYYSKSNKAFLLEENVEKTLYYYPVDENQLEDDKIEITADAIFISDDLDQEAIENAKYDGEYEKENVDSTIKFVFNNKGYLVSYQYSD